MGQSIPHEMYAAALPGGGQRLRGGDLLGAVLGKLEVKRPGLAPLAGKSTLNRLEHAPVGEHRYRRIGHDPAAIENLFVDLFLDSHARAPKHIVLDLDATDDPLHGHQEGRFFHGYYDGYFFWPMRASSCQPLSALPAISARRAGKFFFKMDQATDALRF